MTRLLVVEDEEHIANGLKFNLEAEGYCVDTEENGEAALRRLTSEPDTIDLVLLDVMLPGFGPNNSYFQTTVTASAKLAPCHTQIVLS